MAKKLDQGCGIPPRSHTFLGKLFGMLSRPGWLTSGPQPGQARDQGAGSQRRELPPLNGLPACTTAAPDGIISQKIPESVGMLAGSGNAGGSGQAGAGDRCAMQPSLAG